MAWRRGRSLGWRGLEPERVEAIFARQRARDRFGHGAHLVAALVFCFCLALPTSVVEIALAPLLVTALVRIPRAWRVMLAPRRLPLPWLALAWAGWMGTSALWSVDPAGATDELGYLRWLGLIVLLWPVLDRRDHLITALVAGFALGVLVQVAHGLDVKFDLDWPGFRRQPGRLSGWWDPVVGGTLLCGALGLNLAAAIYDRGGRRVAGLLLSGLTAAGIAATGTRGAWVAGAALVVLALAPPLLRRGVRRRDLGALPFFAAVAALALLASWSLVGPAVRARAGAGLRELEVAWAAGHYESDTGRRLLMWWWAGHELAHRPVQGVGVGSYRAWAQAHAREHDPSAAPPSLHEHAHGMVPHAAATTGLVGLGLLASLLGTALISGLREPPGAEGPAGRRLGPALGLAGVLLAGLFDTVHLSSQGAALLWTLAALCQPGRPVAVPVRARRL
ncbi:MAG TPA: O-antigen ligase family protein [Phycisphaerales bacterium]|nr:O-antigen ligase family protein [Phycisphaerales bacterium]